MTAINSLFDKMQQFVTHENVVFMLDPKQYRPVEDSEGGGGSYVPISCEDATSYVILSPIISPA